MIHLHILLKFGTLKFLSYEKNQQQLFCMYHASKCSVLSLLHFSQESLNQKEIRLNLWNIFSILIFNELIRPMVLKHVKLGHVVTLIPC